MTPYPRQSYSDCSPARSATGGGTREARHLWSWDPTNDQMCPVQQAWNTHPWQNRGYSKVEWETVPALRRTGPFPSLLGPIWYNAPKTFDLSPFVKDQTSERFENVHSLDKHYRVWCNEDAKKEVLRHTLGLWGCTVLGERAGEGRSSPRTRNYKGEKKAVIAVCTTAIAAQRKWLILPRGVRKASVVENPTGEAAEEASLLPFQREPHGEGGQCALAGCDRESWRLSQHVQSKRARSPGENSIQGLGVRLPASELYNDRGAGWGLVGLVHGLRRIKSTN